MAASDRLPLFLVQLLIESDMDRLGDTIGVDNGPVALVVNPPVADLGKNFIITDESHVVD